MEKCNGKIPYYTRAEADAACESLKADARKTGEGGTSYRRLEVYPCGRHFHIGRGNSYARSKQPAAKKIPSTGELKRKLKAIDKRLLAELKHRAFIQQQIIEASARRDYENALAAIGIKE